VRYLKCNSQNHVSSRHCVVLSASRYFACYNRAGKKNTGKLPSPRRLLLLLLPLAAAAAPHIKLYGDVLRFLDGSTSRRSHGVLVLLLRVRKKPQLSKLLLSVLQPTSMHVHKGRAGHDNTRNASFSRRLQGTESKLVGLYACEGHTLTHSSCVTTTPVMCSLHVSRPTLTVALCVRSYQ
jgi:hypothetical protein